MILPIVALKTTTCLLTLFVRWQDDRAKDIVVCYLGWYLGWLVFGAVCLPPVAGLGDFWFIKNALIDSAFVLCICVTLPISPIRTWLCRWHYFCIAVNVATYLEAPATMVYDAYDYLIQLAIIGELATLLHVRSYRKIVVWPNPLDLIKNADDKRRGSQAPRLT